MQVVVEGELPAGVTAKDIALAVIGRIGTGGGTGYAIEFAGDAIRALSMEGRMTVCNMAIEAGARAGMVARRREDDRLPAKAARSRRKGEQWDRAVAYWRTLTSDRRRDVRPAWSTLDARDDQAAGHVGHVARDGGADRRHACRIPRSEKRSGAARRHRARARVHGARRRTRRSPTSRSTRSSSARAPTRASRTCARRRAVVKGRHVAPNVKLAMVVPGSGLVKAQAESEGLDKVFTRSRFRVARAGLLDVPRR